MEFIAFDSHKAYTLASVADRDGRLLLEERVEHEPGRLEAFLSHRERGSPVAVETIGNWYWILDEVEAAGMRPRLVHARKAKLLMGMVNKTDRLDARGLNVLQRMRTLPEVWIPPRPLRDYRELTRSRMALVHERSRLKCRIHATVDKYALGKPGCADLFGVRGRRWLEGSLDRLPPHTAFSTRLLLEEVVTLDRHIGLYEQRLRECLPDLPEVGYLRTLPGVGVLLATVMALEVGDVKRFARAERLAAYAGTTPRVHSSGGKTRMGRVHVDVNRCLKWAFIEAANCAVLQRRHHPGCFVCCRYTTLRRHRGHGKAVVAVARHLAEAAYWVLTKREPYRPPQPASSRGARARTKAGPIRGPIGDCEAPPVSTPCPTEGEEMHRATPSPIPTDGTGRSPCREVPPN